MKRYISASIYDLTFQWSVPRLFGFLDPESHRIRTIRSSQARSGHRPYVDFQLGSDSLRCQIIVVHDLVMLYGSSAQGSSKFWVGAVVLKHLNSRLYFVNRDFL